MSALQVAVLAAAATFFGVMSVVSMSFFRVEDSGARLGKRVVSLVAGGSAALVLWRLAKIDGIDPVAGIAALALYVYSTVVFVAAWLCNRALPLHFVGSSLQPEHLSTRGPYGLIRHPFYSSYIAAWLASAIAVQEWAVSMAAVVLVIMYLLAAKREEKQFLASPIGEQYAAYRLRTGMLFPSRLGGAPSACQQACCARHSR